MNVALSLVSSGGLLLVVVAHLVARPRVALVLAALAGAATVPLAAATYQDRAAVPLPSGRG